jgi:hypothetical protein
MIWTQFIRGCTSHIERQNTVTNRWSDRNPRFRKHPGEFRSSAEYLCRDRRRHDATSGDQQIQSGEVAFKVASVSSMRREEILKIYLQTPEGCALARDIGRPWQHLQKDGDAVLLEEQTGQNSIGALICIFRPATVEALIAPAPRGRSRVDGFLPLYFPSRFAIAVPSRALESTRALRIMREGPHDTQQNRFDKGASSPVR